MHHVNSYAFRMSDAAAARLKMARETAGFATAKAAAEAMGVSVSTYIQHENGSRGIPAARAARYARFFRTTPEWLLYGRGESVSQTPPPELTTLPLIGEVRAGAWLAVDETPQDEPEQIPIALDRRYPHARQWLREVVGDSMDARFIFPGDIVHLVDLTEAGVAVKTGDIVEVTRFRDGAALREVTLKEVEVTANGLLLWPRSNNPLWKVPVKLDEGAEDQDIQVQITGLLLSSMRRF